jgi:hypothetical protein
MGENGITAVPMKVQEKKPLEIVENHLMRRLCQLATVVSAVNASSFTRNHIYRKLTKNKLGNDHNQGWYLLSSNIYTFPLSAKAGTSFADMRRSLSWYS